MAVRRCNFYRIFYSWSSIPFFQVSNISVDSQHFFNITFDMLQRNVYNQKVYGMVEALVSVGYEYGVCSQPKSRRGSANGGGAVNGSETSESGGGGTVWQTLSVKLAGFQPAISDIGGWTVNIHHRLAQGR
jgi:hypothetical protein